MHHPLSKFLALALLFSGWAAGQAQETTFNLEQAINYAESNNPDIRNALLNVEDADAQITERKSVGLPQLNGSVSYQRYLQVPVQPLPESFVTFLEEITPPGEEVSREASFFLKNNISAEASLDAMIFDGSYFVALRAARAARSYAQLELQQTQRQVRMQVADAYLPVLLLDANLTQLDKNIANLERLLFETREIYKEGFAEQLDVDRLELSLANLETERDNLRRQRQIAVQSLKFVLNYPADEPIVLTERLEDVSTDLQAEAVADSIRYERRPEVNVLEQAEDLNQLNVRLNRAGYLPSLRAFGAYTYQYQGDTFSDGFWAPQAYLGVRLNVPIFDGFYKKALVQRASIDLEQVRLQQQTLRRGIRLEVDNARLAYDNARERLADRQRNLDLAQRIYDTTQVKYREGVGSSLEVSQAEQSLYDAQSNRLRALYDLYTAKIALEEALGLR